MKIASLRLVLLLLAGWLWLLGAPTARAQEAATGLGADLEQQVRHLAEDGSRVPGAAPRIEVTLGQLDPRLRLAPCQRIEPYLPNGVRLWGRARIGLRCVDGPTKWNVYLPVTVKVFGQAVVATTGTQVGNVLGQADVTLAEVDLAEDNSPAIADPNLAIGHALNRALRPGQAVRQSDLKPRQWFAAGDTVKVIAQGSGFAVAGEGQALTNGLEGQMARVRTESGRVVTGVATGDRQVELSL
jgi:flagella basal body P-ring formation protein FlgA